MRLRRLSGLRIVVVGVMAAFALWIALGVTLTLTQGRERPTAALALWPWGSNALAYSAADVSETGTSDPSQLEKARDQAVRALRHEPGNVIALRALGIIAALQQRVIAAAYISAAERFSRRDLPVEFALIETEVARGDIDAALTHYDRALRIGYRAYDTLFPVLIAASSDPAIARPLGRRLAARPAWWNAFVERAIQNSTVNPNLGWLMRQVRLRADRPDERVFLIGAMQRLVGQGDIAGAQQLYRDVRGNEAAQALLRDGSFKRNDQLPPFEWQLTDTADLAAVRQPTGSKTHLELVATGDQGGVLAQQLLTLSAGPYRLTMAAGDIRPGAFTVRVTCLGARSAVLADQGIPAGNNGNGASRFVIPLMAPSVDCPAQWLTINANGGGDPARIDTGTPWIGDIAISRIPG